MKERVFVLVNTLHSVSSFVYGNHIPLFVYTAKNRPDVEFRFWNPHRMGIDNARNTAAVLAQMTECTHLLFLDDDVMVPEDSIVKALNDDKDILAGLVIIRGWPFNVMGFKFPAYDEKKSVADNHLDYYNDLPLVAACKEGHKNFELECDECIVAPLEKLVKMDAVGFSFCLIKMDVFPNLEPPYFLTGKSHTEDIYFCLKLRNLEPVPEVWMDTEIQAGHLLNPEPIEWVTRRKIRTFYQHLFPKAGEKVEPVKRDDNYIRACLAQVRAVQAKDLGVENVTARN